MSDLNRVARIARAQATDLRVAARGADVTSTENSRPDQVKPPGAADLSDATDLLRVLSKALGLAGTYAGGTLKSFKQAQEALGRGSRDVGYELGEFVLATVMRHDGTLSVEAADGARDAARGKRPVSSDSEYGLAFERVSEVMKTLPANQDVYPRTRNGFRAGIIASVAIVYAAAKGEPMLTRMDLALARSGQPGWSPANLVYGQRDNPAHSVIEAVKEVTERALEMARETTTDLQGTRGAVLTWIDHLEQARQAAPYGGPDEALEMAYAALSALDEGCTLIGSADNELAAWEKDL